MRHFSLIFIVMLCASVGLALFYYKTEVLSFPLMPDTDSTSWHVEAKVEFQAQQKPVKLSLYIPRREGQLTIVDEQYVAPDYGLTTKFYTDTENRRAIWSKRKATGKQILYYRGVLYEAYDTGGAIEDGAEQAQESPPKPSVPVYGSPLFKSRALDEPLYIALDALITELYERSADETSLINNLFQAMEAGHPQIKLITGASLTANNLPSTAVLILNHSGIPARLANGVTVGHDRLNASFDQWVEVFLDERWQGLDMKTGSIVDDPRRLTWWVGEKTPFELSGGRNASLSLSISHNTQHALTEALWKGNDNVRRAYELSLFSLPIDSQLTFQILLMVPLGALVSAFTRQVIGIPTFGTFMPVLIALAFRETQLVWGILLFSIILSAGMIIRSWLARLQLLLVPRLTALLTVVVMLMSGFTLLSYKLDFYAGLSISLFPMVILAMTIERLSVTLEEVGRRAAFTQAIGSLVVAIAAFYVMNQPLLSHLIFTFPELLLVVLALSLLLGRYNGYKLTEYYRFRTLGR